jgi:hypothetical protein
MTFNKQAKVALSKLEREWKKYLYTVLPHYVDRNTHRDLHTDCEPTAQYYAVLTMILAALYQELTAEVAQHPISSLIASTSTLSLSAPTLEEEQDWQSMMTVETVLQEPLPMERAHAPDVVIASEDTLSNERGEEFSAGTSTSWSILT